MKKLLRFVVMGMMSGGIASAETGPDIVEESEIKGGLIVLLGCGDGRETAELRVDDRFVVQGLDVDKSAVQAARKAALERGDFGDVSFMHLAEGRLPYAADLVNLLVVEDPGRIMKNEMMRVLVPLRVLMLNENGKWVKTIKPWPEEIDQGTHYLHGPDNNAVSRDRTVNLPRTLQ